MNDMMKEIDEEIRREQADKAWSRFLKLMAAVCVVAITATAVHVVMQNRQEAQAMEKTGLFIKAEKLRQQGDNKGAAAGFAALADPHSTYYGSAMLNMALAEEAASQKDQAMKDYQALAAHDQAFGALAAMHLPAAENKTEPSRQSPFYYSQSEWKAWQLLQGGKKNEAITLFLALRDDPEAPESMRERMSETIRHLAPDKTLPAAAEALPHD